MLMYKMPIEKYQSKERISPQKGIQKKAVISVLVVGLVVYGFFRLVSRPKEIIVEQDENSAVVETQEKNEEIVYYEISEGDIPAEVFSAYGKFDANDTGALLSSAQDIYDFTSIKIGKKLRFYFDKNSQEKKATRIEYDRDTEEMIVIERHGNNFDVHVKDIPYEYLEKLVKGKIDNFFYIDAMNAGLSEATVLEVGDLFSFGIDFTTEVRQGDEFSIFYEKRTRDGEDGPDGKILAAKFVNEGKAHYAYYFDNEGEGGYYDQDGYVLERQFLRAPLSYRRITSGFTGARYHPITRTVSAHYQIDYAAPIGTPVVATARGTVVSAGWEGGWGRIIRMRHDNGYTTHYGHLNGFASGVSSGVSVSQGQTIGYVGSTGWSTGPHLDYGMKLNGTPVNPLKLELPKGDPLGDEQMKKFEEVKNKYIDILK